MAASKPKESSKKNDNDEEKSKSFSKKLFASYIDSKCQRQLLWTLSKDFRENWLKNSREPLRNYRKIIKTTYLQTRGHEYEDIVYSYIISKFPKIQLQYSQNKKEDTLKLNRLILKRAFFTSIYEQLKNHEIDHKILLENEYITPKSFKTLFFKKTDKEDQAVTFGNIRPDIMIIGNKHLENEEKIFELLPSGTLREISDKDLNSRYAISIIDIKRVILEKIGKRQFTEILYYLWSLSCFLKDYNLQDKFFISMQRNGIFPPYKDEELESVDSIENINALIVPLSWKAIHRIFRRFVKEINLMWNSRKHKIEKIELNINSTCAFCPYFTDCLNSLNYRPDDEKCNLGLIGLELIPYTSRSISKLFIENNCKTVLDANKFLRTIKFDANPNPLYTEHQILRLKTEALKQNKLQIAESGSQHSYLIPKNSPITLIFSVETSPPNDSIFATALYFTSYIPRKFSYGMLFEHWWKIWKQILCKDISLKQGVSKLNDKLEIEIEEEDAQQFLDLIESLGEALHIMLPGDTFDGKEIKNVRVNYIYADVNKTDEHNSESKLISSFINKFSTILNICNYLEKFISVAVSIEEKNTFYSTPETAIFYWGKDQWENLKEGFERNLDKILANSELYNKFDQLITWINPQESEVENPFSYKKFYDLKQFVESVAGFPSIINYTWHEISSILSKQDPKRKEFKPSKVFWPKHFNFMDFNVWYYYLETKKKLELCTSKEKNNELRLLVEKQISKIIGQIKLKTYKLNEIRTKFQRYGKDLVSKYSRPIKNEEYQSIAIEKQYHPIAHVWYLFSKLCGSIDAQDVELIRATFIDESIGKLKAAQIRALQRFVDLKSKENPRRKKPRYYFSFELTGISRNMKMDIGNQLLIIPKQLRDLKTGFQSDKWKLTIKQMIWMQTLGHTKEPGYYVITDSSTTDVFKNYSVEFNRSPPADLEWFAYPTSMDAWSSKLYRRALKDCNNTKKGLLQRDNFGESELGKSLAGRWEIRSNQPKPKILSFRVNSKELYIFAPDLLNSANINNETEELQTKIHFPPDSSQTNAIKESLNNVIYGIQGPPGTGKSSTIAALVDEFYLRQKKLKKRTKILITAFSYSAIRVLVNKIREGMDKEGDPTPSSKIQMIYVRSQFQNPIEDKEGLQHVNDLVRKSSSWKWDNKSRIITPRNPLDMILESDFIMFSNAHQLYHLRERITDEFSFNLILVDEASQLPIDYLMSSLQFIKNVGVDVKYSTKYKSKEINKENQITYSDLVPSTQFEKKSFDDLTKLIVVGDYNQLPPVQPVDPPKNLEPVLDSAFSYYVRRFEINNSQLKVNYRSNEDIVNFTSTLGIYSGLRPSEYNKNSFLKGDVSKLKKKWLKEVLDKDKKVLTISHPKKFDLSVSRIEADITAQIAVGYFRMVSPKDSNEEKHFWKNKIGVVAPHNAQGRLITHLIFDQIYKGPEDKNNLTFLEPQELMNILRNSIYSVEKFQGSDRNLIIASIGISDLDQLQAESEFIYDLNRFNVLTSRAKNKIIMICSDEFINFSPSDREIMEKATKIQDFALEYCTIQKTFKFTTIDNMTLDLAYRYH